MQTTLPQKSQPHQEKLTKITNIIKKTCGDKLAFVILFGSFARGNWVIDQYLENSIIYEYSSDYDILVIVKGGKRNHHPELQRKIEQQLSGHGFDKKPLDNHHSVHLILEPLNYVNKMLQESQYFFSDIKKEGVVLYQNKKCLLSEAKQLSKAEKIKIAREDYEHWIDSGIGFLTDCKNAFKRKDIKKTAFYLHQATESFFHCTLLVFTGYKHKTHYIDELYKLCCSLCNKFLPIFATATDEQQQSYQLLKASYIDARYNKDFQINENQLQFLIERIEKLQEITKKTCLERL